MTPPPADEMPPPDALKMPMPAMPPAALAEIERAYTLLQPGQAPLTIPSINQEELERMLKDRAGDIERIQVEQGLQGIDQEKMQKFFKDHPADQKRLKILMRNQELRGKQFAKAWSKSPKAFTWNQTPKAFTWNQTPKAFSWKEGDKNRSWIQTNPNTAPPTFMFNEGSLAEILGRAKAKALKEGKPDVAEQIQRAIESLGKGE